MAELLTRTGEDPTEPSATAPLRILGRANSFNVRKVLWVCDEIGIAYTREDFGRGFAPTINMFQVDWYIIQRGW